MKINIASYNNPFNINVKQDQLVIKNTNGYYVEAPIHPIDCKNLKIYEEKLGENHNLVLYIRDDICFTFTQLLTKLIVDKNMIGSNINVNKQKVSDNLIFTSSLEIKDPIIKNEKDFLYFGKELPVINISYNLINNDIKWVLKQLDYPTNLVIHNNETEILEEINDYENIIFVDINEFMEMPIFNKEFKFVYITDFENIINSKIINFDKKHYISKKIKNLAKIGSKFLLNQQGSKISSVYSPLFCMPYFQDGFNFLNNSNLLWFANFFKTEIELPNYEKIDLPLTKIWENQKVLYKNQFYNNYFISKSFPKWTSNKDIQGVFKNIELKKSVIEDKISKIMEKISFYKKHKLEEINTLTNKNLIKNKIQQMTEIIKNFEDKVLKYQDGIKKLNLLKYNYNQLNNSLIKNETECPICLEDKPINENMVYLTCSHSVCSGCCSKLVNEYNQILCPLCRKTSNFNECFMIKNQDKQTNYYVDPKFIFYLDLFKNNKNTEDYLFLFENQKERRENEEMFLKLKEKNKDNKIQLESITNIKKIQNIIERNIKLNKKMEIIFMDDLKDEFIKKFIYTNDLITIKSICY